MTTATKDTLFRVSFSNGAKIDVTAPNPDAAREMPAIKRNAKYYTITKIKRVRAG